MHLLLIAALLTLTACGDAPPPAAPEGSDEAPADSTAVDGTRTVRHLPGCVIANPEQDAPAAADAADGQDLACDWAPVACRTAEAVNGRRAAGGTCDGQEQAPAEPLAWAADLEELAALWADNPESLQGHGDFAGRAGPYVGRGQGAGENIYLTTADPDPGAALQGWIDSPGHCMNLHRPEWTETGLAVRPHGDWTVFVQVFRSAAP